MAIFQTLGTKNEPTEPRQPKERSTANKVLRHTMLPGIIPRIRKLGLHFGHFAYLLALVFNSARLIPSTHPVLNASNIGRFGVRQVIALAANNIVWSKKNIDQIAIFSAIIIGLIVVIIQAVLIAIYAGVGTAFAAPSSMNFFTPGGTYQAVDDPIMLMFAQVFGALAPSETAIGFWGISEADAPGSGSGIQTAVHQMLSLYSMATMVIAVIIVLYYVLTVIAEAAQTGTPFGRRFNSVWAPIRLVVALGLLIPLGSGLNSAQYITLWVAKMGSGLGTNIWFTVADSITQEPDRFRLAEFQVPWVRDAAARIFFMEVCRHSENKMQSGSVANDTTGITAKYTSNDSPSDGVYGFTLEYVNDGHRPQRKCGKAQVRLTTEEANSALADTMAVSTAQIAGISSEIIRELSKSDGEISKLASQYAGCEVSRGGPEGTCPVDLEKIYEDVMKEADRVEQLILTRSVEDFADTYNEQVTKLKEQMQKSWIYAGIWYLEFGRLLQATKDMSSSAIPNMTAGSVATSETRWWNYIGIGRSQVGTESLEADASDFNTSVHMDWTSNISVETQQRIRSVVSHYYVNIPNYLKLEKMPEKCKDVNTDSGFISYIACFTVGFIVPENLVILADPDYKTLDPMTSLINAGKEITDRAVLFIAFGLGADKVSPIIAMLPWVGPLFAFILEGLGKVALAIAPFGLAAGLILYFLLPIFPFMYLFFAAVAWVMEIFEAIVAMPLWALAHLRIDGDGMPGQAAMSGYYLLLAILLRPGLIVLGMIGGVLIFNASVYMLQGLFREVILMKGAGSASGLELLIYTLIFAYIAYTAGITSFKLVDDVPNQILRWIGSSAGTFSAHQEDPASGNTQLVAAGAAFAGGQLTGGLRDAVNTPWRGNKGKGGPDGNEPPTGNGPRGGDGGGSGAPDFAAMGEKARGFMDQNPKGPTSSLSDRPTPGGPNDSSTRFSDPRAANRFYDNKDNKDK